MASYYPDGLNRFLSPSKIVFGKGSAGSVADEVRRLGGTKVLVVTDKVLLDAGVINPVLDSLKSAGIPIAVYDGVLPDAPVRLIKEAFEVYKAEGCDLVVGAGGGSSLDTSKMVSVMATNDDNLEEMLGVNKIKKRGVPKIILSTTTNAGADSSWVAMVTKDEETHEHVIVLSEFALPEVVITDPSLSATMPKTVTADTGVDCLTTGIESLLSKGANPISDMFAEKIIHLCSKYLPLAYNKGSDMEARYYMALAGTFCGPMFMSSWLGSLHGLSYVVAGAAGLSHGRSLGAILPHVIRGNIPGCADRLCRVAELMGKNTYGLSPFQGAELAVKCVEELLDSIEVSYRLRDYGIKENDLAEMARTGHEETGQFGLMGTNPCDLTVEDVLAIYQAAY